MPVETFEVHTKSEQKPPGDRKKTKNQIKSVNTELWLVNTKADQSEAFCLINLLKC